MDAVPLDHQANREKGVDKRKSVYEDLWGHVPCGSNEDKGGVMCEL